MADGDDLERFWELSNKTTSRIPPLGQQILAAMDAGYQVGDVLTDTTVKILRGLERHLQRSSARIVKGQGLGDQTLREKSKSHKTHLI